jgi:hypothetical protein
MVDMPRVDTSMLPRDTVSLEELNSAHGGIAGRCRVHTALRRRVRSARLEDGDQRASGRREVLPVFARDPEDDTVGPSESDLNGVFSTTARRIRVGRVELSSVTRHELEAHHPPFQTSHQSGRSCTCPWRSSRSGGAWSTAHQSRLR